MGIITICVEVEAERMVTVSITTICSDGGWGKQSSGSQGVDEGGEGHKDSISES